jgi:hypothetical protein
VVRAARDEIVGPEVALKELVTLTAPLDRDDILSVPLRKSLSPAAFVSRCSRPPLLQPTAVQPLAGGTRVCTQGAAAELERHRRAAAGLGDVRGLRFGSGAAEGLDANASSYDSQPPLAHS